MTGPAGTFDAGIPLPAAGQQHDAGAEDDPGRPPVP
jgi:hypothetical protein